MTKKGPYPFSRAATPRKGVRPLFRPLVTLVLAVSLVAPAPAAAPVSFADVTAKAGIRFVHTSGAFGKKYLPETMGSGCVFFDADGDGWQDIFLVNSSRWPGRPGAPSYSALYRNNRNGTFSDVTRAAGLQVETYGMGVAAADYDNDGLTDLYVTALGPNHKGAPLRAR